jgi:pyridoxine kinase
MPTAIILSSYVAAARIGGGAQQLALAALGIEAFLVPTVLLGASPARAGKGRATDPELYQALMDGLESEGLFGRADLLVTGHFSFPEQVRMAADAIAKLRAGSPGALVVVDPVLGDAPKGLYVKPEVAAAVAQLLVPLADWITPNLWELGHLSGRTVETPAEVAAAARSLGQPALVTSAPAQEGEIGLLLWDGATATRLSHVRAPSAPNGTGDLVTAVFAAGLVEGLTPLAAAQRAAGAAADAVSAAQGLGGADLPLATMAPRLVRPQAAVRIEALA